MTLVAPYITDPANVTCQRWSQVDDAWFSTEPLRDTTTGLYARLTYRDALAACARLGGTLPGHDDVVRLHDDAAAGLALELTPVTLPDTDQLGASGIPNAEAAIATFRNAHMIGLPWAQRHDGRVRGQLDQRQWDQVRRLANCGKHWIAGAPPGRAYLMGWWSGGAFIQAGVVGGPGPHDDLHHAYGTLTLVRRLTRPDP
jgi:hypothetical protein